MDLDLFSAFDGAATDPIASAPALKRPASPDATSSDVPSVQFVPRSKRMKQGEEKHQHPIVVAKDELTEEATTAAIAAAEAELPVFTNESITTSETGTTVKQFTALPVDYTPVVSTNTVSRPPAKTYPFKLDSFQQEAVNYIDRDESVLVAAHTSAGKTAVAEYAIAKSLRDKQRVIYTSPIKALSNQKFRDLQEEFGDVGLMTGDMTINPSATCLIMTTEILRSMLFRGSEVMREVAWVIYDEVHYMRDKERGVVWEESIILLPHKVRFVFLSATIPNAKEFVGWVAKTHHQPCHVVYTDYRPVPLQHFIFPGGADGLYLVVDEKSNFREENFQRAMSCLQSNTEELSGIGNKKLKKTTTKGQTSDLGKIIRLIMEKQLEPCIVFSFSKKECETNALQTARLDFNTPDEKNLVEQVYNNAIEALSEDDRKLPQIETLLPLLKRGVGIHHGGLLPILKEIIEILFQEGLIKCLFATETFSIGINMPAKTVVFTSTRKFDGKDFRWITSGEYIQMSGRAGRRGKDDRGIVIQMIDEKMEPDVAKGMIYGDPDPLYSSYHIGYNMVLNMLRVEDADPEHILRSSFHQYQQEKNAPELERKADEIIHEAKAIVVRDEDSVSEYYNWSRQASKTRTEIMSWMQKPQYCLPFLQSGRLVRVQSLGKEWGWGIIMQSRKLNTSNGGVASDKTHKALGNVNCAQEEYVLDVLLEVLTQEMKEKLDKAHAAANGGTLQEIDSIPDISAPSGFFACPKGLAAESVALEVIPVSLSAISNFSAVRIQLPKDVRKEPAKRTVQKTFREVLRRFSGQAASDKSTVSAAAVAPAIPLLDPIKDMAISDAQFKELLVREEELKQRISACRFHSSPDRDEQLTAYSKKMKLLEAAGAYRAEARTSQAVALKDELKRMKRVLRRLGFVTPDGVLEAKGRLACEISTTTGYELVLTDMIFDGFFNSLTVEQTVALISCFVHQEAVKEGAEKVRQDLQIPYRHLQAIARNVARVSIEAKIAMDEEEFVKAFNPDLMDVTYAWCQGAKFSEICRMTDVFEGSIIRVIRRLEELLRQLAAAALAIGNVELKNKFEEGADKMRRGIVFAASLYL